MSQPTYQIGGQTFTVLFPELLRPLSQAEEQALRESIARFGVQVPIVVDESDGVIDGGHRCRIAAESGVSDVPARRVTGLTDEEKRNLALSLNADRRQLTPEEVRAARQERKERVAELRSQGKTTREIAEEVGVSQPQVLKDLKDAEGIDNQLSMPDRVTTSDGRTYPARRPVRPPQEQAAVKVARETHLGEVLGSGLRMADLLALKGEGLHLVGDLLDRAAKGDRLKRGDQEFRGEAQLLYATLRAVAGLSAEAVNKIGDAIIDAGLLGHAGEEKLARPAPGLGTCVLCSQQAVATCEGTIKCCGQAFCLDCYGRHICKDVVKRLQEPAATPAVAEQPQTGRRLSQMPAEEREAIEARQREEAEAAEAARIAAQEAADRARAEAEAYKDDLQDDDQAEGDWQDITPKRPARNPRETTSERSARRRAALEDLAADAPDEDPRWKLERRDCLEGLQDVEIGSVRLIFADPPYNVGWDYGDGPDNDRLDDHQFCEWCEEWMRGCRDIIAGDGSLWVLIGDEQVVNVHTAAENAGWFLRQWIVWFESFGVNCTEKFNRTHRHLLWFVFNPDEFVFNPQAVTRPSDRQEKYADPRANPAGKLWDSVWGINPPIPRVCGTFKEAIPDSPAPQLPLALLRPIIGCASDPGDLVLDPFTGNATTGVAALELGRRFHGFELREPIHRLAKLRLRAAAAGHLQGGTSCR